MDNNIELFDAYIDGTLSVEETLAFDRRLKEDATFREDFRIYLLTLKGVIDEGREDNLEFSKAMKHLSENQLNQIIGRKKRSANAFLNIRWRERAGWIASMAALVIVGIFVIINVMNSGRNKVDDLIVYYNNVPLIARGGDVCYEIAPPSTARDSINYCIRIPETLADLSVKEAEKLLPSYEEAYKNADPEDVQEIQMTGLQLSLAYIKIHKRKEAKTLLEQLINRFPDDESFREQCQVILNAI